MRKIVSYLLSSLDGVVEEPGNWVFDRFNNEMSENLHQVIKKQDAVLLGRRTYEQWQQYWPTSDFEPFASFINNTQKYVISSTLDDVDWQNTTLIKEDALNAIQILKEGDGGDIGVHGSPTLVGSLLQNNLLDELKLAIFPAIGGTGLRMFELITTALPMRLTQLQQTNTGVLYATYESAT